MPVQNRMKEIPLSTLRVSIADMILLNVRTRGPKNLELPEVLYQSMPARCMALMATIPSGVFAVSIRGESDQCLGYPILKTPPLSADGFVITYARKPNNRYEAAAVQYQGGAFEIAEFSGIARHWVEQHMGRAKAIPGHYAYFAPDKDEWGVILRDSGFTACDPSGMQSDVSTELRARLKMRNGSAIVARIPVYAGEKQATGETLPVFTQVEVALESESNRPGVWISFSEYQKRRAIQSRLPDSIISDFNDWLSQLTQESGFEHWTFQPGMLFGDCIEWWGDGCRRRTTHEGVDFARGMQSGVGICSIREGVPVRSMADGEVVATLDDFLGKTVVVRHPIIIRSNGDVFHTLLSHIQPLTNEMKSVTKGQILGRIGKSTNARVTAHLHLTGAWLPRSLTWSQIRMDHIHPAYAPVSLANFADLMQDNPLCSFEVPGEA